MSYFQSESMEYCQAIMPREQAWEIMDMLGRMDSIHIIKPPISSSNFDNPFQQNLKRCDEILNKIRHIRLFIEEFSPRRLTEVSDLKKTFREYDQMIQQRGIQGYLFLNEVEEEVQKVQSFLIRQKKEYDGIREDRKRLVLDAALLLTLARCNTLEAFQRNNLMGQDFTSALAQRSQIGRRSISRLEYKCGLINRNDQMQLKRIIFRISHGNAWVETFEVDHESVNKALKAQNRDAKDMQLLQQKLVFIIIFQTGEHNVAEQKITKVLNSMDCYVDNRRPDASNLKRLIEEMETKKDEHDNLAEVTREGIASYLEHLYEPRRGSESSYLSFIELYTKKQKCIYEALSTCNIANANNFLIFNAFVAKNRLSELRSLKAKRSDLPSLVLSPKDPPISPPTLIPSCQILEIPQEIVNTYGVPTYKQFNPATLYIVTFGFFVGVMFGDVGHMLLAMAVVMYLKPNKWWWTLVFWMGYCGLIYNQFFGLNIGLFDSCYKISAQQQITHQHYNCVYPFGLDPVWKVAQNRMSFTNSFKMKLAVILGVVHMSVGICLRGYNSLKRSKYLDFFSVVIPQFIFMGITFVYMDFLIILKWFKDYSKDPGKAPSIINLMMSMVLGNKDQNALLLYQNEKSVEKLFVILMWLLIFSLLLIKPLVLILRSRKHQRLSPRSQGEVLNEDGAPEDPLASDLKKISEVDDHYEKQQHHDNKEMVIHQLIETIEFVLGSVSNTASYLRLWALSLAHNQLSDVFFDMMLEKPLIKGYSGIFLLIVVFVFFISVTFGVLVCMDIMECFLHSLRLHWVEFQNKFYAGGGYLFRPFSFQKDIQN